MKYKYTRKEVVKRLKKEGYFVDFLKDDLLAQKEDRKECKHFHMTDLETETQICSLCGHKNPTPSPLEDFEDIAEQNIPEDISCFDASIIKLMNLVIRNQKKLYQFIKEKL